MSTTAPHPLAASPVALLSELAAMRRRLADIAAACDAAAHRLLPEARPGAGPCERYRAAADAWPAPPPSHERLGAIAAGLHDASFAVRRAAAEVELVRRELDTALQGRCRATSSPLRRA